MRINKSCIIYQVLYLFWTIYYLFKNKFYYIGFIMQIFCNFQNIYILKTLKKQ